MAATEKSDPFNTYNISIHNMFDPGTLHIKQSRIVKMNVHIHICQHQDNIYVINKNCMLKLMKISVFEFLG